MDTDCFRPRCSPYPSHPRCFLVQVVYCWNISNTCLGHNYELSNYTGCPAEEEIHSCLSARLQGESGAEEDVKKKERRKNRRKRRESNQNRPDWATLPDLLLIKIFKFLSIEVRIRMSTDHNSQQHYQERHHAALACRWWSYAFR